MDEKAIVKLIMAYGYEFDFEDVGQRKKRYASEQGFIDVWNGKKGITVGVYIPEAQTVKYVRRPTLEQMEVKIIESL